MNDCILRVENVSKSFGGVHALKNVSMEIMSGEIHCLAGENGSGKSTIIKIVSGFYTPDDGIIEINNKRYTQLTPKEAIREGIQVIYQDMSIFPNLTVMENLSINMELMDNRKVIDYRRMKQNAQEALSRLGVFFPLDELVGDLSVGERQVVAICRALLFNTKLVIMDEPTSALNKKEVAILFGNIRKLQEKGVSVLFVSHKLDEVFEISEKYTIFRNGKNVATGNTRDLDSTKFAFYMTGRTFDRESYKFFPENDSVPMLEVKKLSLKNVFTDISFSVRSKEILGITGLLGSGREEIMLSLFGLFPPDSGEIYINGKRVQIKCAKDAINSGLGYVPSDRISEGLFQSHSVQMNTIANKLDNLSKQFGLLDTRKIDELTEEWINALSIVTKDKYEEVQNLSGGNQQKVMLSRWLSMNLSVLVLNGPTVGVDIGAKYDIYRILQKFARNGMALILISDDIPEIMANCNRVLIVNGGKIVKEVRVDNISESELGSLISHFSVEKVA
mgnify:CR=1 FL=1